MNSRGDSTTSGRIEGGPRLFFREDEEPRVSWRAALPLLLVSFLPTALLYRPPPTPLFIAGPEFGAFELEGARNWAAKQFRARLHLPAKEGFWRPLEAAGLWGIAVATGGRPEGYFVARIVLHGFAALLVGLLVERIARSRPSGLLAAAVFAVHPVASHATNYLAAFNEHFVTIGVLGSLLLFLRALRAGGRLASTLSVLCFAAALLCKEIAIVAPLLALGAGIASGDAAPGAVFRRTVPLLALAAAYLAFRLLGPILEGSLPAGMVPSVTAQTAFADVFVRPWEAILFPLNPEAMPEWTPVLRWFPSAALAVAILSALRHRRASLALVVCGAAFAWIASAPAVGYLPTVSGDLLMWRFYYPSLGAALVFAGLLLPAGRRLPSGRRRGLLPSLLALSLLGISTEANGSAWRDARRVFGRYRQALEAARPADLEEGVCVLVLTNAPVIVRGVGTGAADVVFCAAAWGRSTTAAALAERGIEGIPLRVVAFREDREIDEREIRGAYGSGVRWYAFRWDGAAERLERVGSGRT